MSSLIDHSMYEKIFESHPSCFSLHKVVKASRRNYETALVGSNHNYNSTFTGLTHLESPYGFHDVIKNYFGHHFDPDRVIQNLLGQNSGVEFFVFSEPLSAHFSIQAYAVGQDHFVVMYNKMSKDKRRTIELPDTLDLHQMLDDLKYKNDILKKMNERLFMDSITDNLTNIFNRQFLIYTIERNIHAFNKTKSPFCLALFDIDNFKHVNDDYGHLTGDRVLVDLAMTVKENIRENDIFGRYGGDEFILVLPQTEADLGRTIVERIRHSIEVCPRFALMNMTMSGGLLSYNGESLNSLLELVDERLYIAKNDGKNKIIG